MVLKKRKQYEAQLKNYMTHQFTLNQVAFTSDNIQNTLEMVNFWLSRAKLCNKSSNNRKKWWKI